MISLLNKAIYLSILISFYACIKTAKGRNIITQLRGKRPCKNKKTDINRTVLGHSYSFDKTTISSIVVKSY